MRRFKWVVVSLLATFSLTAQIRTELYRPFFHYSPNQNWMSDPNGLVYYNNKYHLFYQYNPNGLLPGNTSWGHATSSDLVNWEEKPIAIPVQNGVKAYSGSVVVDWNNTSGFGINGNPPLVAIYTGSSNVEDQRIAYSNDDGLTWQNYTQNPVINSTTANFRDPKVFWYAPSQKWIMVLSVPAYQAIYFYSSPNLKNWTFFQDFGNVANKSKAWECPDFFPLPVDNNPANTKWVLAHSVEPNAQYFIGDFNGTNFNWENTMPAGILIDDFERDNYGDWTKTGGAFGTGPAVATTTAAGFLGNRFIYSFVPDNSAQGKLVSSNFTIQKKYISFLLGGGYHPNSAYIKLIVNGQVVRKATGLNEDIMKWRNWEVSSLLGQTARIEIVDSATLAWGHINVDHIIQSDVMNDNPNNGQIDYGKDFYALQSFSDVPGGRRIWLAWMNSWSYATRIPTSPWRGFMSIPREVMLETHNGRIKLVQKPVAELTILRKDTMSYKNTNLSVIHNAITELKFKQFELKARISTANKSGFSLKFKKNGTQYSEFIFDFINQEIIFNRSKSGGFYDQYFAQLQVAPLIIENGFTDLHLFVDNSSAELFSAGGQVVMSNQIFPDSTSNKIELTPLDQDLLVDEFDIWNFEKGRVPLPDTIPPPSLPLPQKLFEVFPNPIGGAQDLTVRINNAAGDVKFELFNPAGMLIDVFHSSESFMVIPSTRFSYSKGLYILKGTNGKGGVLTRKILVF